MKRGGWAPFGAPRFSRRIVGRSILRIGIVGLGYVGKSVQDLFEGRADIVAWDIKDEASYPTTSFGACDFAVICVDTPPGKDGAADTRAVEKAVARMPIDRILLKSTVPPGTTDRIAAETGKSICFWPEYIGESRYHNPYFPSAIIDVPFAILGGTPSTRQWFIDRLLPFLGPTKTYFQCSAREAELIKYAENAFFAMKITFVNELRRMSEAFGADWHTVREGWLLDPRVGPMHTAAFHDQPGFSGKCLPKDLTAIIAAARGVGYQAALLEAVKERNEFFRQAEVAPDTGEQRA